MAIACVSAVGFRSTGHAQEDTFVSPTEGAAGSRFQIVGEVGWTAGETVTIDFGFSDEPPGDAYAGPFYNEQPVTVLRDGTWSFPVVVNRELFPFPLWRPGYIVVRARGASQTTITPFAYVVEGRRPLGEPPLADFGFGPEPGGPAAAVMMTVSLFAAGVGAMLVVGGRLRRCDAERGARSSRFGATLRA